VATREFAVVTQAPVPGKPFRVLSLDLLRLLAVLLVLGRHRLEPPAHWPAFARAALDVWHRGGWIGVDLFFVLSGFLVSGLLFSEYASRGRISPGRFYIRRGFKIYPAFYVLLAISAAVWALRGWGVPPERVLAEAFFVQSYYPGFWVHTWSLAVEEHFYLALPLVLLFLARRSASGQPFRWLPLLVACVCLVCLGLRIVNASLRDFSDRTHLFPTHLRLDSLLFGVWIAYLWHFHRERFRAVLHRWRYGLIVLGVLLLAPAFLIEQSDTFLCTEGLTLAYLGSAGLMVGLLLAPVPEILPARLLGSLGAQSYSVYLWHLPVLLWGVPLVEYFAGTHYSYGTQTALYVGGSFVVGVALARLIEVPALALRDRFFPSRSKGPVN
jgi:peptidoglycan/LPS O-acetylase OafA/YrhL